MAAAKRRTTAGLDVRALNRATLARQSLLARSPLAVPEAVARVVGLQAQLPGPPYVGLWSRVAPFAREDLAEALASRALVRATSMRATLHVMTADDYVAFRPVLQPVLARALRSLPADRTRGFDVDALARTAARYLADGPRTFEQIRTALAAAHPGLDVRAMGYAVRTHLPLIQVPGKGAWGFAKEPDFALAESWIGRSLGTDASPRALVLRYLAAFGPATARDAQTWCGLTGLAETLEALRPDLVTLHADDGRELFDLPDAPRPPGDTPAPPRFLPEFDDLVLGHADRRRVVPDEAKPRIFLSALRVRATLLVDGFVRGAWSFERGKKASTLVVEPFAALDRKARAAVEEEASRLAAFLHDGAGSVAVRFEKP